MINDIPANDWPLITSRGILSHYSIKDNCTVHTMYFQKQIFYQYADTLCLHSLMLQQIHKSSLSAKLISFSNVLINRIIIS